MKGGVKDAQYGQTNMAHLWNVMDSETRFLISSTFTKYRDAGGADWTFRETKTNAHNRLTE